jgi:hypothetical protein
VESAREEIASESCPLLIRTLTKKRIVGFDGSRHTTGDREKTRFRKGTVLYLIECITRETKVERIERINITQSSCEI